MTNQHLNLFWKLFLSCFVIKSSIKCFGRLETSNLITPAMYFVMKCLNLTASLSGSIRPIEYLYMRIPLLTTTNHNCQGSSLGKKRHQPDRDHSGAMQTNSFRSWTKVKRGLTLWVKRGLTENSVVLIERQRIGHTGPVDYAWFPEVSIVHLTLSYLLNSTEISSNYFATLKFLKIETSLSIYPLTSRHPHVTVHFPYLLTHVWIAQKLH